MDWIGSKLTQLIHEGQKALGREVVLPSTTDTDHLEDDDQADDDDDEADAWVEDGGEDSGRQSKRSRFGHTRGSGSGSITSSPRMNLYPPSASAPMAIPIPIPSPRQSSSLVGLTGSVREDESAWMSPELRESMERARAMRGRYLQ